MSLCIIYRSKNDVRVKMSFDTVFLRTFCSRNPKNIRNPPRSGYFLMFCGSQSHICSGKHEKYDLLTLVSNYWIRNARHGEPSHPARLSGAALSR